MRGVRGLGLGGEGLRVRAPPQNVVTLLKLGRVCIGAGSPGLVGVSDSYIRTTAVRGVCKGGAVCVREGRCVRRGVRRVGV